MYLPVDLFVQAGSVYTSERIIGSMAGKGSHQQNAKPRTMETKYGLKSEHIEGGHCKVSLTGQ